MASPEQITANHMLVMGSALHRILDQFLHLGGSYEAVMAGRHICHVLTGGDYVTEDNWCAAYEQFVRRHLGTAPATPEGEV